MKKLILLVFIPSIILSQDYSYIYHDVNKIPDKKYGSLEELHDNIVKPHYSCLLYTSPSPRDGLLSRMPSSA